MNNWPALPLDAWRDTRETLHRWMQIVGKIQLELTPLVNHWWNVTFLVTTRGLRTQLMQCDTRSLEMEFDFLAHVLRMRTSDGGERTINLEPKSVARFFAEVSAALDALAVRCRMWPMPVEIENPVRFDHDETHRAYDGDYAQRFWRILEQTHHVFTRFRADFLGKCSPVHFFWGSFDLAVTRFSGRRAPEREGVDAMTREAYSHEVSSVGFWPGDQRLAMPSFYSYAAPEPPGFRTRPVSPAATYYNEPLGGFYLHYDDLRAAADPAQTLLDFCHTTYDAAADTGAWDRAALERQR
jgi:hypothetical protein